jgi:hypothetical protein
LEGEWKNNIQSAEDIENSPKNPERTKNRFGHICDHCLKRGSERFDDEVADSRWSFEN